MRSCIRDASVIPGHIIGTYSYRSMRSAADRYCVTRREKKKGNLLTRVQMTETRKRRTERDGMGCRREYNIIRRDNVETWNTRRERRREAAIINAEPNRYRQMKISTRFPKLNEEKDETQ